VERWARAYDEYRDRVYLQALSRMAETFLPGYRLLRDRTGNDLSAVERARGTYTKLDHVMDELWQIYRTLHDRRWGSSRLIGQAPWEFRATVAAIEQRWADILSKVHYELFHDGIVEERPRTRHAAEALDHKWLDDLLGSLPPPPEESPDKSRFDPYHDSIADLIEALEFDCRDQAKNGGEKTRKFYEWKADGLVWLQDTAGLDFSELQKRWKEVSGLVPVPDHVAKDYIDAPRGLFGYLDQIRLAYLTGADLPAIALCRTTAELLIRRHYASDIPDADDSEQTGLTSLIRQVQTRPKYQFLTKPVRLIDKVREANEILHARMLSDNVQEIPGPDRLLVRSWLKLLKQMIEEAPAGSADSLPSPIARLKHIIDAIESVRSETAGVSLEAFEADWRKRWLVERGGEIISEASRRLSEELKARHPKIPWRKVAGIGDVLRDGYERVKPVVLWRVARDDLGPVERACRAELAMAGA
jgi:uncharacterized protein with HEPN domain